MTTQPHRRRSTRVVLAATLALGLLASGPAAAASRGAGDPAVQAQQGEVDEASTRLDDLSAKASAALEAYQAAARAKDEAQAAHDEQVVRWTHSQAQLDSSRREMARFAAQAHRHGAAASGVAGLVAAVGSDGPLDLEMGMTTLRQVGRAEARAVAQASADEASQESTAEATEATAQAAASTAEQAEAAKAEADERVAAQRAQVDELAALVLASRKAAASGGDAGQAVAGQSASRLLSGGWGGAGGCSGDDLSGYANGRIPASALCPLAGSPGEQLRSDAAGAFDALNDAYSRQFGQGMCVTDSYRDLASQVAVHRARPRLAAKPGTSNHGWGVAVDLCGGIESFGGSQHRWMRQNAPAFGWFHPGWAQQGGSKPEAWHWEFAG